MVKVIDVVMRMNNDDEVKINDNGSLVYHGTVRECKKYEVVHRLVIDKLLPFNSGIVIKTMSR